jgi:D-alanine-D-alanine ligase
LIELNSLPGLTALSYLPRIAAHRGITFPALCERILDDATLGVRETRR